MQRVACVAPPVSRSAASILGQTEHRTAELVKLKTSAASQSTCISAGQLDTHWKHCEAATRSLEPSLVLSSSWRDQRVPRCATQKHCSATSLASCHQPCAHNISQPVSAVALSALHAFLDPATPDRVWGCAASKYNQLVTSSDKLPGVLPLSRIKAKLLSLCDPVALRLLALVDTAYAEHSQMKQVWWES